MPPVQVGPLAQGFGTKLVQIGIVPDLDFQLCGLEMETLFVGLFA